MIDVTFTANGRTRKIKGMQKLDMLPNETNPLLLFLGVSPNGGNAVFLVDSTLETAGEGKCKPSKSDCAFVYLGAGSEQVFTDEDGKSYDLAVDQIRKVKLDATAASASEGRPDGERGGWYADRLQAVRPAASLRPRERVQHDGRRFRQRLGPSIGDRAMRRLISISLLLLSAVALLVASPAAFAAKKKSQANLPEITRVQPMRISVGGTLTITGKRFKSKRSANTVIFRAGNGRSAFAKPRRASTTKLVVVVPAAVARLLTVKNSNQRPTRLKLRVLAGKFSKFTTRRLSPVVTGAGDGDGPGSEKVCQDDADHDNDLLSNARELQIGTDPCLDDTDADKMSDGWEYCSAKDLNANAVPYPGERPFTNALDPATAAPDRSAPTTSTATA